MTTAGNEPGEKDLGPLHPTDADPASPVRRRSLSAADPSQLAALLGGSTDSIRSRILLALHTVDELCVKDLMQALHANQSAVGYGLRVLRAAGLVTSRRDGRVAYYRLAENFPAPLRDQCLRTLADPTRAEDEALTDNDSSLTLRQDR